MAADERGPDWDPITGNRTWNDVKDHQFTGLSGLFGAATTSPNDPPPPAALRDDLERYQRAEADQLKAAASSNTRPLCTCGDPEDEHPHWKHSRDCPVHAWMS